MKSCPRVLSLTLFVLGAARLAASDASIPEPRMQSFSWMSLASWFERHAQDVAIAEVGGVDLLFVGDSITEGWENHPIWKERFVPLHAANFGIGGDATQNVLWRFEHGATGNLKPGTVVLLIGTNNFHRNNDAPADVVRGITAVVVRLAQSFSEARLIVFGIFPRGRTSDDPLRAQIAEVNKALRPLDDGHRVLVRDIGGIFLEEDGSISTKVMPDFLHLSGEGYRRWAEALLPLLTPGG